MDWLANLPPNMLTNGSAVGILVIVVLGIIRGWLIPGSSLDKMLAMHEARLLQEKLRGDEWRQAYEAALARAAERDAQTEKLLEVVTTTVELMETLRKKVEAS